MFFCVELEEIGILWSRKLNSPVKWRMLVNRTIVYWLLTQVCEYMQNSSIDDGRGIFMILFIGEVDLIERRNIVTPISPNAGKKWESALWLMNICQVWRDGKSKNFFVCLCQYVGVCGLKSVCWWKTKVRRNALYLIIGPRAFLFWENCSVAKRRSSSKLEGPISRPITLGMSYSQSFWWLFRYIRNFKVWESLLDCSEPQLAFWTAGRKLSF